MHDHPDRVLSGEFIDHPSGQPQVDFHDLSQIKDRMTDPGVKVSNGDGCLLIKRRVFRKHFDHLDPLRFMDMKHHNEPSSDILFHRMAQEMGFKSRIHGGVHCGHLPNYPLDSLI